MTKVQLSLTQEEAAILTGYGSQLGYSLPKTIKYMISKAAESVMQSGSLPEYKMSEAQEKKGFEALHEHRAGKTTDVSDPDLFFKSL
jgi:hypothetical protein